MTMTRRTVVGVAMLALLPGEAASQCVTNPLDQLLLPGETVARTSTEGVATSLDELLHGVSHQGRHQRRVAGFGDACHQARHTSLP